MSLSPALASERGIPDLPEAGTPVLLDRPLAPGAEALSVFGDDRWSLTPAVFEAHASALSLNFLVVPEVFRPAIKHYFWQLINHDAPHALRNQNGPRISIRTAYFAFSRVVAFVNWLQGCGVGSLEDIEPEDLDRYLDFVAESEISHNSKEDLLGEVRRLWSYRSRLPHGARLPLGPPWNGDDTADLLETSRGPRGNKTPRIPAPIMEVLLMWALRFVQDISADILAAAAEEGRLWSSGGSSRGKSGTIRTTYGMGEAAEALSSLLATLRADGGSLPGRIAENGQVAVNWSHMTRLLGTSANYFRQDGPPRAAVLASGLPIETRTLIPTPITGRLELDPWRPDPIALDEVAGLCRLLSTACFIVMSYLSGARPGEILNLPRGCVCYDPKTKIWQMRGRAWKGACDEDGQKVPQGAERPDPWTVVEPVAEAVAVLERLHDHPLLFPIVFDKRRPRGGSSCRLRPGEGRTASELGKDITQFIAWVNAYCQARGLDREQIPADPAGAISPSRFRRTLAWHIVRRPRGLVAAAIQYGHVDVRITVGYAGTSDSGFPDERAYEDWLFRLEQLAEDEERLAAGEHVSGPAADTYRHRVHAVRDRFAGRVLTSVRQAQHLLANPELQIYPGKAMTCVFDPDKAQCQLRRSHDDITKTPDQDDCRPSCRNIAYTDRDIAGLSDRARELAEVVHDPMAPSIRNRRDRHELERIQAVITRHARKE